MIKTNICISSLLFTSLLLVAEITCAQTADLTNDQESLTIESGVTLTVKGGVDNKTGSTVTNYGTISVWEPGTTGADSRPAARP